MVKGCLLKPLQERWTQNKLDKDFCASAFDFVSFEPRYLNTLNRVCILVPLFSCLCGLVFCHSASDCALATFRTFYECFRIYSAVEHSGFIVVVVECL